jgi:hypothetical protein
MKSNRKARRPGATETFSVSVDPETKRALRALADEEYGGNLSALVTDFAAEARRRKAAGAVLRLLGVPVLSKPETDALASAMADEVSAVRRRRKRRVA